MQAGHAEKMGLNLLGMRRPVGIEDVSVVVVCHWRAEYQAQAVQGQEYFAKHVDICVGEYVATRVLELLFVEPGEVNSVYLEMVRLEVVGKH
jgi:hypothetical protein